MPCTTTWLSSSASKSSSPSFTVCTSVSLCWLNTHSTLDHTSSSLTSVSSIFASFCARSTISPTSSSNLCSCSASRSSSLNLSSITKCTAVASMSIAQCRSRMSGERRSATRGMEVRKFFTEASTPRYALVVRTFLGRPFTSFTYCLVLSSIMSVLMSAHSVVRQSENCTSTSMDVSHTSFMKMSSSRHSWSSSFAAFISSGNSNMLAKSCRPCASTSSAFTSALLMSSTG
mmetsp:Transcript_36236/g.69481  ORF Transcript_36236/g.69481 Transcript_36236/m.69481 type:complete len:231 (+) Transcript_36236:1231-1923(+)